MLVYYRANSLRYSTMLMFRLIYFFLIYINVFIQSNDDSYCHAPSMTDFVRDTLPQICFNSDSAGFLNASMNHVDFYHAHCRIYQEIKQCLDEKLSQCETIRPGFHRHILNLIESYQLPLEYFEYDSKIYDDSHYLQNLIPFCDGDKLSSHFSQQFDRSLLTCLTKITLTKHKQCLTTFKSNIQIILERKTSLNEITKWSEDYLRCIYNSIPTNCSPATKEIFVFRELLAVPEKQDNSSTKKIELNKIVKQKLPSQNVEGFVRSKRATSSIHGDPHLVQLHTNKSVTCQLLQNRTYISNPFFKITGIAKHVGDPELTATAISSLQIDFFDLQGHLIGYYRAMNGKLPFEIHYLDSQAPSMIKIDHGEQNSIDGQLTILHIPTSTQFVINRWSKFFYFLVRSSEILLNNSNGYLITGCPQTEILDRQMIITRLRERFARSQQTVTVSSSDRQRRHVNLLESQLPNECERICSFDNNEFFEECLFDCLALAVTNASQALQVDRMHRHVIRERKQLIENDQYTVKQFKDCYDKGVICKTMSTDCAFTSHVSKLLIVLLLFCIFYQE